MPALPVGVATVDIVVGRKMLPHEYSVPWYDVKTKTWCAEVTNSDRRLHAESLPELFDAIIQYVLAPASHGKNGRPATRREKCSFVLSPEVKSMLEQLAYQANSSQSTYISYLIAKAYAGLQDLQAQSPDRDIEREYREAQARYMLPKKAPSAKELRQEFLKEHRDTIDSLAQAIRSEIEAEEAEKEAERLRKKEELLKREKRAEFELDLKAPRQKFDGV